jgi:hypothetical protein
MPSFCHPLLKVTVTAIFKTTKGSEQPPDIGQRQRPPRPQQDRCRHRTIATNSSQCCSAERVEAPSAANDKVTASHEKKWRAYVRLSSRTLNISTR